MITLETRSLGFIFYIPCGCRLSHYFINDYVLNQISALTLLCRSHHNIQEGEMIYVSNMITIETCVGRHQSVACSVLEMIRNWGRIGVGRPTLILLHFVMFNSFQTLAPILALVAFTLIGWTWIDCIRRSKIRLYHAPIKSVDSLANLVKNKVPSLGRTDARLPGIWWLPGCVYVISCIRLCQFISQRSCTNSVHGFHGFY